MLELLLFYFLVKWALFYLQSKRDCTEVIYSSKNFIIVNKQADFKINSNNSLEETVQTFLKRNYPEVANNKLYHEFYFPHRLDYATSGILCIPIDKTACKAASKAFSSRTTNKYYLAIVRGLFSQDVITISFPIGEDPRYSDIQKMCTTQELDNCKNSRPAQTILIKLEEGLFDNFPCTKIMCKPITGRRHQIRVHCSSVGHTIVGDYTYSNKKDTQPVRMYLHSLRLVLPNDIEHLDISTDNPFANIASWKSHKIYNTFSSAYEKINNVTG